MCTLQTDKPTEPSCPIHIFIWLPAPFIGHTFAIKYIYSVSDKWHLCIKQYYTLECFKATYDVPFYVQARLASQPMKYTKPPCKYGSALGSAPSSVSPILLCTHPYRQTSSCTRPSPSLPACTCPLPPSPSTSTRPPISPGRAPTLRARANTLPLRDVGDRGERSLCARLPEKKGSHIIERLNF
jgi:hypothetical protein